MSKKRKIRVLLSVLCLSLVVFTGTLVACSTADKKDTVKKTSSSSKRISSSSASRSSASVSSASSSSIIEPEEPKGPKSVLTNQILSDPSLENKRLCAFMIENSHASVPHYGINKAGVIYECPMEGGMTRYMAVFDDYSGLDRLGNLRSCRPYFAYIASEYDAVYIHFGQSVQGQDVLNTGIVSDLNGTDGSLNDIWFRSKDRKSPFNAYTTSEGVDEGIKIKGYRAEKKEGLQNHFIFAEKQNELLSGEDCKALSLYHYDNQPYFIYDEAKKTYKRFEYGEPEIDAVDGKQIEVSNIILQYVPVSEYEGYFYLNIPLNGTGKGKFITNGKAVDITWSKDSNTAITHYFMPDGKEIELNPGKTWVSLIQRTKADENKYYSTVEEFSAR